MRRIGKTVGILREPRVAAVGLAAQELAFHELAQDFRARLRVEVKQTLGLRSGQTESRHFTIFASDTLDHLLAERADRW